MHMQQQELDFFLGALSPTGFSSYYTQVVKDAETQTSALLKAGPGCGKSTLLRRIAAHLEEQGETVELIHCSQRSGLFGRCHLRRAEIFGSGCYPAARRGT